MGLEHILRNEPLVFPKTGAYHRQCRGLHTPHGVCATPCGYREGLRAVDAHEPVRFAAGLGGEIEVVIFLSAFQICQSLTDSLVGQ